MTTVDPVLNQTITQMAPEIMILLAGVTFGAGITGLVIATLVNHRRHDHLIESTYIRRWLYINGLVLLVGGLIFVWSQVVVLDTSFRIEIGDFARNIVHANEIGIVAAGIGAIAAACSAAIGYRAGRHHRHI